MSRIIALSFFPDRRSLKEKYPEILDLVAAATSAAAADEDQDGIVPVGGGDIHRDSGFSGCGWLCVRVCGGEVL